jgi:hypothetical protein
MFKEMYGNDRTSNPPVGRGGEISAGLFYASWQKLLLRCEAGIHDE